MPTSGIGDRGRDSVIWIGTSEVVEGREQDPPMENGTNAVVLSIDEIDERCDGEWVLVRVTGFDQNQRPSLGQVIEHSPSREVISAAFARESRAPAGRITELLYI